MHFLIQRYRYEYLSEFKNYYLETPYVNYSKVVLFVFWLQDMLGVDNQSEIKYAYPAPSKLCFLLKQINICLTVIFPF